MKIKNGVSLVGIKIQMRVVMKKYCELAREYKIEPVITAGTEYARWEDLPKEEIPLIHSCGSLHPYGYALDLRSRELSEVDKVRFASKLQKRLDDISSKYRVIVEKTHIHVEWRGHIGCS